MSLMDHLRELRTRLFKCACAILVAGVVVYFFFDQITEFALRPYCEAIAKTTKSECKLLYLDAFDPFTMRLRVATYGGMVLASPVLFWQLWSFIAPGLYKKERRYASAFVFSSVVLFSLGAALAYISLPEIYGWLLGQAPPSSEVVNQAQTYFEKLALMVAAFGLSFEFPLLLLVAQMVGLVTPDKLAAVRRHAIVGIVTVVAVITPGGDPVSLFALSIPLCLFYEASICIARLLKRRKPAPQ